MPQVNDRRSTRRRILFFVVLGLAMAASFVVGSYWEHFRNGRWYQVHDSRSYKSTLGTFHLRHVTDTQGWPFLDTGTSVLSFEPPMMNEIMLYRSNRIFQESFPWVNGIQFDGNNVQWSDGQYHYSLHLEPVVPTTQP